MSRIVLGRGINALIPDGEETSTGQQRPGWQEIPTAEIHRNPDQPRHDFDPARLAELSESIRRDGMLQPILVHKTDAGFELIAGERRLRAAQMIGMTQVPTRVFENVGPRERAVLALVENLQREDLNAIEEASGYQELQERFGLSQEELASAVGKDRSTVANSLRLLKLPEIAREAILKGDLTAGHGRALLSVSNPEAQVQTTRRAVREGWSVRRLEREVSGKAVRRGRPLKTQQNGRWSAVEDALKRKFGTAVRISHRLGKGKIVFEYYSEEELTRLVDLFEVRLD